MPEEPEGANVSAVFQIRAWYRADKDEIGIALPQPRPKIAEGDND
jgi:hypothetical protein